MDEFVFGYWGWDDPLYHGDGWSYVYGFGPVEYTVYYENQVGSDAKGLGTPPAKPANVTSIPLDGEGTASWHSTGQYGHGGGYFKSRLNPTSTSFTNPDYSQGFTKF